MLRSKLIRAGLPTHELEESGRLVIADFREAYQAAGTRGVINVWEQQAAESSGILWGTGSHRVPDWSDSYDDFLRFEEELHRAFQRMNVVALCPCLLEPVDGAGFQTLLNLVPHHSGTLFTPNNETLLMRAAT